MDVDETIVAIASAASGGPRGIVRVSGPGTVGCVSPIFRSDSNQADWRQARSARRTTGSLALDEPLGDVPCDLLLWPTRRSYTRQPMAELHTFGAPPILQAAVQAVCGQGARLARPGEFTLRAFLAGRIDLAQAEAILGVIDAVDRRQLDVALRQLAGGLSQPLARLREELLNLCADIEAGLDFVDEDIQFISADQINHQLTAALEVIADARRRMRLRDAGGSLPRVVLRGEPNVGKSSLWNKLTRQSSAIVTDVAGTTRDYLSATVSLLDTSFTLIDTAGAEPAGGDDPLSTAIQRTADQQAEQADLLLLCIDATRPPTDWERAEMERIDPRRRLVVLTKSDQLQSTHVDVDVVTSTKTGQGMDDLVRRCAEHSRTLQAESTVVASTALRCRESLGRAEEAVAQAAELNRHGQGDELVAAELRGALDHLGEILGAVYTDDVLDRVFSRFCIGK